MIDKETLQDLAKVSPLNSSQFGRQNKRVNFRKIKNRSII